MSVSTEAARMGDGLAAGPIDGRATRRAPLDRCATAARPRARRGAGGSVAAPGLAPDQKNARRTRRAIIFVDETGHTFRARLGTTWAPIGQPPILRRMSQRREVSSIAGLVVPLDRP